ncbi:hypothetical protein HDA40_007300 [Hamadaea flava]|uniref:Uncharacterized protein n=1 Tax=Hamadaea flava TaxID=1742688 RepID=A0ABV8LYR6_9ACTN|nr:hypothetical protein [Hamadaea flava]MCP2328793.1 hypothetical protein [Hamadaea flava]
MTAGEVSLAFGVSLSGAEFLRDTAEAAAAALPLFIVGLVLSAWLMARQVRLPWRGSDELAELVRCHAVLADNRGRHVAWVVATRTDVGRSNTAGSISAPAAP